MKILLLSFGSLLLFASNLFSADFNCAAGNVNCLIVSIQIANGNGEDNTIFLEAGTYTLGVVNNFTDGPNGLPSITGRITIRGPSGIGSAIGRDTSGPEFRIFHIASTGILTLDWVGLRGGMRTALLFEPSSFGGAIQNRGVLSIHRSEVYNNSIVGSGSPRGGGGISNSGTLTITHSWIRNNCTTGGGGGIDSTGRLLIEDSFVVDNANGQAAGGGLHLSAGSTMILRSTVARNGAEDYGAGIVNLHGFLHIEDSAVHDNRLAGPAAPGGVGIFNKEI